MAPAPPAAPSTPGRARATACAVTERATGIPGPSSCSCTGPDQFLTAIADAYGETCGGCPLAAGIDPDPDPDPAADDAATTPADEEGAGAADTAADAPAFPEDTGVADTAVGRERRLAAGLREFGGRARAAGTDMAGWWEVTEREWWDSVGEGARSGLFR
jgi:hypothetical protein